MTDILSINVSITRQTNAGLAKMKGKLEVTAYTLSSAFSLERLGLNGRNNFAVTEDSGYACVGEQIQAPSQTLI